MSTEPEHTHVRWERCKDRGQRMIEVRDDRGRTSEQNTKWKPHGQLYPWMQFRQVEASYKMLELLFITTSQINLA